MKRNEEVQFHLSRLIIRSKVIIKGCIQREKGIAQGRERTLSFLSRGIACYCVRLKNTGGARKESEGRKAALAQGHGDKEK